MDDNRYSGEAAFKAVRWHLGHYWEIKQAVSAKRADMKRHINSNIGGIQDSKLSDPTAAAALSNLTPIRFVIIPAVGSVQQPEQWVKAIDVGLAACSEDVRQAAKKNFWDHKPARYVYTAVLDVNKDTFYRLRETAVATVAVAAAQYGLIRIGDNEE